MRKEILKNAINEALYGDYKKMTTFIGPEMWRPRELKFDVKDKKDFDGHFRKNVKESISDVFETDKARTTIILGYNGSIFEVRIAAHPTEKGILILVEQWKSGKHTRIALRQKKPHLYDKCVDEIWNFINGN